MESIADSVASEEFKTYHEKHRKKQINRIFKSAMLTEMGVPWKEIVAAVPELIGKTPSMFIPKLKGTNKMSRRQLKKWLSESV